MGVAQGLLQCGPQSGGQGGAQSPHWLPSTTEAPAEPPPGVALRARLSVPSRAWRGKGVGGTKRAGNPPEGKSQQVGTPAWGGRGSVGIAARPSSTPQPKRGPLTLAGPSRAWLT